MRSATASCATCAKAKSKCVRLPSQDACDRCTRLRKECHTREHGQGVQKAKKVTKSVQLRVLQEKIGSLTNALVEKPRRNDRISSMESVELPSSNSSPAPVDSTTQSQRAIPTMVLESPQSSSRYASSDTISVLSPYELQILLDRYTTRMAPYMPFVLLPAPPITTNSFSTSPLLLQAIVAVSYFHDTSFQRFLVQALIHRTTSAILTNAEKSLDLLQALLILCTWYNPHIFTHTSHTSLLHMCMALTTDLAIDRDPSGCEMAHMVAALASCGIPQPVKIISDEERRAVLGVFWLASTIFTSFRKTDVPLWTPWLAQCLEALEKTGLQSDSVLVGLVQRQKIMHQAMLTTPLRPDPGALDTELDSTHTATDPTLPIEGQTLLNLHHACALIALREPSFTNHNLPGIWSCISMLNAYLTLYTSLPVSLYLTFPFTVFAQFAFVFVVMVRASSIHFDGFDGTLLRELVDFETVMEQASERYEAVGRLCVDGERVRNRGFENWAAKCRWAKTFYAMKARERGDGGDQPAGEGGDLPLDGDFLNEGTWIGREEFGLNLQSTEQVFM